MAKRARARSPSWHKDPDAIIEEPARELTDLLEALNTIDKEVVFSPPGPIQMSALLVAGGYKTAPITGDTEMTFSGVRMGKRGKLIFEFAPVEPGEFKQLEMDEAKVFDTFPALEELAKRAIGGADSMASFSALTGAFMADLRRKREREAVKAKQEAERSEQEHYSDHPDWGLF